VPVRRAAEKQKEGWSIALLSITGHPYGVCGPRRTLAVVRTHEIRAVCINQFLSTIFPEDLGNDKGFSPVWRERRVLKPLDGFQPPPANRWKRLQRPGRLLTPG